MYYVKKNLFKNLRNIFILLCRKKKLKIVCDIYFFSNFASYYRNNKISFNI